MLFRALLRHAPSCDDIIALRDVAETINANALEQQLPAAEVEKTVESAWKIQIEGRNRVGKEPVVETTLSEFEKLAQHAYGPDGHFLLTKLRFAHWDHDEFAASAKLMWKAQVIPGWARDQYRRALAALTDTEILRVVHRGGRGANDPRLFTFSNGLLNKGLESRPNITVTPSPLPVGAPERQRQRAVAGGQHHG